MKLMRLVFRIFSQHRPIDLLRAMGRFCQHIWSLYRQVVGHFWRGKPRAAQFGFWVGLLLLAIGANQVYAQYPSRPIPPSSVSPPAWVSPAETITQTPISPQMNQKVPKLVSLESQREFRGVWVASVVNIDWPSSPDLSVEEQKAELLDILNRMESLNLNALVLQIRPNGDALYASEIEPWSGWLTGTQGKAPQPFYDPLEFAIAESHKRNIELHAWFNPYRAKMPSEKYPLTANHIASVYPQYAYQYGDLLWMDPAVKEIQDWTYNVIMDVVRRYDVDGIHIDDYFYPYPKEGISFPDDATYRAYQAAGGTLSRPDWRRENVNQMIQRIWAGIKAEKPYVKFGISPFGIYRPGKAEGIVGFDQYEGLYADVKKWLDEGWLDYLAPQLYWRIDPPQQSYPVLLQWWSENNPLRRHIYAGNYLSKLDGTNWPISEFERQVEISRQQSDNLSLGNIFFSMKVFKENRLGINDRFKNSVYYSPALPPAMPWLDAVPPAPPTQVTAQANTITWNRAPSNDIRYWTVYQLNGNNWELVKILNSATNSLSGLQPGTYAVAAGDRLANQSPGVVVSVENSAMGY